jgi:hypothetical protein
MLIIVDPQAEGERGVEAAEEPGADGPAAATGTDFTKNPFRPKILIFFEAFKL